jgi:hypothetical protein
MAPIFVLRRKLIGCQVIQRPGRLGLIIILSVNRLGAYRLDSPRAAVARASVETCIDNGS